jgi:tRNA-dihydrouridine synthase B
MHTTFFPKTMLAPMEGVGHPLFRRMMAEKGGIDMVCTEFVRVSSHPFQPKQFKKHIQTLQDTRLSVQVMGRDVEQMREAAHWASELGADVVDINLGCPSPKAVRGGVGSAMLKDTVLLHRVLCAMRDAVPGVLSAKMRAGFDQYDEVLRIAEAIQGAGVDFLVVHPRRRCDFYNGVADWRTIQLLKRELHIPVIGNGDCWYAADGLRMKSETNCDGVMLGRPALRNPWIFQQLRSLSAGEKPCEPDGETVTEHFLEAAKRYQEIFSETVALGKLKEIIGWFGRSVRDQGYFRTTALRTNSLNELCDSLSTCLRNKPSHYFDLDAYGVNALEKSGSAAESKQHVPHSFKSGIRPLEIKSWA